MGRCYLISEHGGQELARPEAGDHLFDEFFVRRLGHITLKADVGAFRLRRHVDGEILTLKRGQHRGQGRIFKRWSANYHLKNSVVVLAQKY